MSAIRGSRSDTADADGPEGPVRTRAVGLLAAGLAHDLNNMLGGIVATAELVQARGRCAGEDARDLGAIVDQAVKASRLIRQVLAFSRQDLLNPELATLDSLLAPLLPTLKAIAGQRAALELALAPAGRVRMDPTALERIVVNLVLNAREAVPADGGRIRLTTARIGPGQRPEAARAFMPPAVYAALRVEDNGPGVPPAIAARIFEPYFTTRPDGQGLGLATAFGLAKQSGGFLLQAPGALGGAGFTLFLPEAEGEAARSAAPRASAGEVILLAEDDMLLRMSTARSLERLGYRVRQAADGEAALKRLNAERPALLLSDIRMPGLDGIALTRAARARHPGLPVLLVSGYADDVARGAVPDLEVAVITKPFSMRELAERVAELI